MTSPRGQRPLQPAGNALATRLVAWAARLRPRERGAVLVQRGIEVPMRDGAVLVADRYLARSGKDAPVVLLRTPYGRTGPTALIARIYAERGYQFVVQSTRGT